MPINAIDDNAEVSIEQDMIMYRHFKGNENLQLKKIDYLINNYLKELFDK